MMRVVFDTDIIIDHFRGIENAKSLIKKIKAGEVEGHISSITEAELLSGKECGNKEKEKNILDLIKFFTKIDVTNSIAQKSGEYRRIYGIGLQDCVIAATAFNQKCILWTRNTKHFKKIKEIAVEKPY